MRTKLAHYVSAPNGGPKESRVLFDIQTIYVVLGVIGILVGMFASAASGIYLTAHKIVPPLAVEALEPMVKELKAADERLRADAAEDRKENAAARREVLTQIREDQRDIRQGIDRLTSIMLEAKRK